MPDHRRVFAEEHRAGRHDCRTGLGAGDFFDARRRSATGYIYTYGLMEMQPLALQMQKEMIAEIEAAKPKYIVFAKFRCSWLLTAEVGEGDLQWAEELLLDKQLSSRRHLRAPSELEAA